MMQSASDGRAQVSWRWRKGAATTAAELGDPGTTDYALCLFDESPTLAQPTLVMRATASAGGGCSAGSNGRPCWRKSARGLLSYRDRDGGPYGITGIRLKPGADGHAEATVTGAGPHLAVPSLPADLPLRVQLQSSTGQCWEETYSTSTRNDATRFRGHSD